jgi:Carbohydrate esterase, sialic acid-specific acetylesterase
MPRPYHRGRVILSTVFILTAFTLVFTWPQPSDTGAGPVPAAPTVSVAKAGLVVSWSREIGGWPAASDFDLSVEPAGTKCTAVALDRCVVQDPQASKDYRFSLRLDLDGAWTPWSPRSAEVPRTPIVIVAGQSNANGWQSPVVDAQGTDVLKAGASPADQSIRIAWDQPKSTDNPTAGLGAEGPVPLLTPQILYHSATAPNAGEAIFGPEISLARQLDAAGVSGLVILKVAQDGTSLGGPGPWSAPDGPLFEALVADARQVIAREAAHGRLATVSAVEWFQGESDSVPGLATQYQANLTNFIESLRRAIPTSSSTPFVIAMTSTKDWVATQRALHWCAPAACAADLVADEEVRQADRAVAASVPHVFVVDTASASRAAGGLHVDSRGELLVGSLLAQATLDAGLT